MKVFIILLLCSMGMIGKSYHADTKQDVILILKGVLEGVAQEANIGLNSIEQCVEDSQVVLNDLASAVTLLESQEFSKVREGLQKIGEAIQVLPDAIAKCRQGEQDLVDLSHLLTALLGQLRNPRSFYFTVGKNLILNGVEIYHETEVAVSDFRTNQYEDFGIQIGKILYQLLVKLEFSEVEQFIEADSIAVTVFKGVLIGFGEAGGINPQDVLQCVTDTTVVISDFSQAVKDFETQDAQYILEGLKLLGEGIQLLPDAIVACKATEQEALVLAAKLSTAIAALRNPKSFAFHIGKDLLVNGKDILKETNLAVYDWKQQNYNDFGIQEGKILYQLLIGAPIEIEDDKSIAIDIFTGVLEGFASASGIKAEDFAACVGDTTTSLKDFILAVDDFKKQTSQSVKEGLELIAEGVQILPNALIACKAAEQEIITLAHKLQAAIDAMATPKSFAFHIAKDLIVNGRDIYKETKTAVIDWDNQDYHDFGVNVGKMLFQVFVGMEHPYKSLIIAQRQSFIVQDKAEALLIFEGVLEGFASASGIQVEDFQACVGDTQESINDFSIAVADFKKQTEKSVLEGLKYVAAGIKILPEALVACKSSEADIIKLANEISAAAAAMATPKTFVFHIGKNLIVNGRDIYKETKTAVIDWDNQDYHDFGVNVGKMLFQVFVGQENPVQII